MQRQYDRVKLHVTLINSLFRRTKQVQINQVHDTFSVPYHQQQQSSANSGGGSVQQLQKRETFDGQQILEKFAKYNFGKQSLREIHLSRRYTTDTDGYFKPSNVLKVLN